MLPYSSYSITNGNTASTEQSIPKFMLYKNIQINKSALFNTFFHSLLLFSIKKGNINVGDILWKQTF